MPKYDQEIYNEIYNEIMAQIAKTHIPTDEVSETINKLLDKINAQKKILKYIHNHFKESLSIMNVPLIEKKEKKENLDNIIKSIEYELIKETSDKLE